MPTLKRYDIKKLLSNPDLRRRLIVDATVATQAREGIDITKAQAENSYYVVTEAERAAFFGLVPFKTDAGENDGRHIEFAKALGNLASPTRTDVALQDFSSIDSSPLAYDRLALVGSLFRENPKLDPGHASAVQGLASGDDPQFIRCWWEVPAETGNAKPRWSPFAKGGSFSRFYSDVYLKVLWCADSIPAMEESGRVQNTAYYFRSGLTWPRRTQRGFSLRRLPSGCIFGDKGPGIFAKHEDREWYLLGILNTELVELILRSLISFGSWEVGALKRVPVPQASVADEHAVGSLARQLHDIKASWDTGNEICTRFDRPWILQNAVNRGATTFSSALDAVLAQESALDAELNQRYSKLNEAVYRLYGVNDVLRPKINTAIGERPSEFVWPQMEGKDFDQKRREHVDRLLSCLVNQIVTGDEDRIVCLQRVAHEPSLLERMRESLAACFPSQDPSSLETEVINELKKKTKGFHRVGSLTEWLHDVFFETHNTLYQQRPVLWHLASNKTGTEPGFACIVHAHRFDRDSLAKLRSVYIRDRIAVLKREAAQAGHDGKADERLDLLARAEEVETYDAKLALLQEGSFTGPEGGERDYRILTPWKKPEDRPQGWAPDLDDGIKVNLAPLARTNLLRIKLKLGMVESED